MIWVLSAGQETLQLAALDETDRINQADQVWRFFQNQNIK